MLHLLERNDATIHAKRSVSDMRSKECVGTACGVKRCLPVLQWRDCWVKTSSSSTVNVLPTHWCVNAGPNCCRKMLLCRPGIRASPHGAVESCLQLRCCNSNVWIDDGVDLSAVLSLSHSHLRCMYTPRLGSVIGGQNHRWMRTQS